MDTSDSMATTKQEDYANHGDDDDDDLFLFLFGEHNSVPFGGSVGPKVTIRYCELFHLGKRYVTLYGHLQAS